MSTLLWGVKCYKQRVYKFDRDDWDSKNVSVSECEEQVEKWAEAQAKQVAETTPQGERLAYLKALKERAGDMVKEASVSSDLIKSLNNLFQYLGLDWETKLPALPRPLKK